MELTSSRPRIMTSADMIRNMALIKFGRAYGHRIIHCTPSAPPKKESLPNSPGYAVTGSARNPPEEQISLPDPH